MSTGTQIAMQKRITNTTSYYCINFFIYSMENAILLSLNTLLYVMEVWRIHLLRIGMFDSLSRTQIRWREKKIVYTNKRFISERTIRFDFVLNAQ